jgi:hypothetical protein
MVEIRPYHKGVKTCYKILMLKQENECYYNSYRGISPFSMFIKSMQRYKDTELIIQFKQHSQSISTDLDKTDLELTAYSDCTN